MPVRGKDVAARIERTLASRGLKMLDVSRESRRRYPNDAAYWIPHHFYADLARDKASPRIEQVIAFSSISDYRLIDWLALFGIRLDDAPRLGATFPAERTVLLDGEVYDQEAWINWFRSKPIEGPPPATAPLGQLLQPGGSLPLRSLIIKDPSPFLYAKIGRQDAFAFPDLLPGSIVRIDTRRAVKHADGGGSIPSQTLFLAEHSGGLTCCRLEGSRKNRVTLRSTQLPFGQVELRLGQEIRILGALDFEMRFLESAPSPEVHRDLARFGNPRPLPSIARNAELPELLRHGRRRAGLSLREASALSARIVEALGDDRYFCTRGMLAAHETRDVSRREIHTLFSLCVLYRLGFWDLLASAGLKTDGLGREPIPSHAFGDWKHVTQENPAIPEMDVEGEGFLSRLVHAFEEIPLFLRDALGPLTGLRNVSLRDIIWLGGQRVSLHPYLRGAVLAAIHRQSKRPVFASGKPLWEQPLYLLILREGSYRCAGCSLEKDVLVVHPFANGFERPLRFRNRVDAEVAGKVVALLRKL
jgi:hypothetical protein